MFHSAVHNIDSSIYTSDQKEAWASTRPDYDFWFNRLPNKQPLLAIVGNRVAGFMELESDGYIDCAYTHPDFQRAGVASQIFNHLLLKAKKNNIRRLYVEASLIAIPFFESRGFSYTKENHIEPKGVKLVNFTMEKYI